MSEPVFSRAQRLRRSSFLLALLLALAVVQVSCDDDGKSDPIDLGDADAADGGDDTSIPPDTVDDAEDMVDDSTGDTGDDVDDVDTADGVDMVDMDTVDTDMVDPCADLTNLCDTEGVTCDADVLTECALDTDGCLVETTTDCADGAGGFCDDSGATAVCTTDPCFGKTLCDAGDPAASCSGETLVQCMTDAQGCYVEMQMDCSAMAGGSCDDMATPPACTVDPCEGLTNLCTTPGLTCDGSVLTECAPDANSCLVETTTECDDGAGGFCDDTGAMPACATDPCFGVSDCTMAGTTCNGETLEVCEADGNGCLVTTATDCTLSEGVCDDTAMPVVCTGLVCADLDIGSVTGTPAITGDNTGAGDDFLPQAGDCFGSSPGVGNDLAYVWTAPQDGCFQIDTENSTGLSDSILKVLDNCIDRSELACDEDSATMPALNSLVRLEATSGEPYIIVVDSYNTTFDGAFDLNIELVATSCTETMCTDGTDDDGDGAIDCLDSDCAALPACATACASSDLGTMTGQVATGTNVGAGADGRSEDCGGDGEDIAFTWTAPSTGCFQFDTIGSAYDTILELRTTCDDPALICHREDGASNPAVFKYDVTMGQEYVLWLDAWASGSGDYVLNIGASPTPCTETVCVGGTDEDGDGLIDCEDPDCFGVAGACDTEVACTDGIDNDADGVIDCLDPDCAADPINGCTCGDGLVGRPTESCDDGNTTSGDGCAANCTIEGESCTDPIVVSGVGTYNFTGASSAMIQDDLVLDAATCIERSSNHELVIQVDLQANQAVLARENNSSYGATISILRGTCGPTTPCERSTTAAAGTSYLATAPETIFVVVEATSTTEVDAYDIQIDIVDAVCGNGIIEPGEPCDDGDVVPGDGCSSTCQLEDGTCANPVVITGPTSYRLQGGTFAAYNDDMIQEASTCLERTGTQPEVVFSVDLTAGQYVRLTEQTTAFDGILSITPGACGELAQCADSTDFSEDVGLTYLATTTETVYLVVEAYSETEADAFDIQIDVGMIVCGNGVLEPGEVCDDGNATSGDGCSDTCQTEGESCAAPLPVTTFPYTFNAAAWTTYQHDHELDSALGCENENLGEGELVFEVLLTAGDILQVTELNSSFLANINVQATGCGDTVACEVNTDGIDDTDGAVYRATTSGPVYVIVEAEYSFESNPATIVFDIIPDLCGNGTIDAGESCDDGNNTPGDGCDELCGLEGESCAAPFVLTSFPFTLTTGPWGAVGDDHVLDGAQGCENEAAGEGELVFEVALAAGETVKVRELNSSFTANLSIQTGGCGDAAACAASLELLPEERGISYTSTAGETVYVIVEAETGTEADPAEIVIDVSPIVCGDGVVDATEACDDGNATAGDGCSDTCQLEGESCAAPVVLTGPYSLTGFWGAVVDDFVLTDGSCISETASEGELVYQLELQPGSSVLARELSTSWTGNVSIITGGVCDPALACAFSTSIEEDGASYFNGGSTPETVFIVLEASSSAEDDLFELVVDIVSPTCGNSLVEAGEACDDGNLTLNDGCSDSCQLEGQSCAAPLVVSAPGIRMRGASWANVTDDIQLGSGCVTSSVGEAELIFQVDLLAGQAVTARELESSMSAAINLVGGSCSGGTCLDSTGSENAGVTYVAATDETVFVVVEAENTTEADAFDIDIRIIDPVCGNGVLEPGEACEDGNLVDTDACSSTCQILGESCGAPAMITGDTYRVAGNTWTDTSDDLQLDPTTCSDEDTGERELVFSIDLAAGEGVRVREEHPSMSTNLSILRGSCGSTVPCEVSSLTTSNELVAVVGGTYYIVVEATTSSESDPWDIRIERFLPEDCGNALDDDRDGLVDCDDDDCSGIGGCSSFEFNCIDNIDNDGDGDSDCADADCIGNHGCEPVTGFYEYFSSATTDPFDLTMQQLVYLPDGLGGYTYSVVPVADFDIQPGTGTVSEQLFLYDGDAYPWVLTTMAPVPFYNAVYRTLFISVDGFVTFGTGDTGYNSSDSTFHAYARVAGIDEWSDPQYGGQLFVDEFVDRIAVTYVDWTYDSTSTGAAMTSQITLFSSGEIRVTFLENTTSSSGTGISSGGSGSTYPAQVDFYTPTPTP